MNRLIIIGNGFDLAHGLPTSYKHFIEDYYIKASNIFLNQEQYNDELLSIEYKSNTIFTIKPNLNNIDEVLSFFKKHSGIVKIDYKNSFLQRLTNTVKIENWVDIENEYYRLLKIFINLNSLKKDEKKSEVEKLNKEFEEVKSLLENYLKDKVEPINKFSRDKVLEFIKIFEDNHYNNNESLSKFYKEFSKIDVQEIEGNFEIEASKIVSPLSFHKKIEAKNYFLSFNYTKTIPFYQQFLDYNSEKINEIHGSLYDESNPINFGFGDEMDDDYKIIENINDNEYLKNIKSFRYLHTSNYKKLLDLVDSQKFQVYIMGHSCGLSDRTLLNTIFEHENCRSIKIYYHQKEDGSDNYTEIIQNISRHFNKKKLMREKIVNKTLCQPLPQIQLPKKV